VPVGEQPSAPGGAEQGTANIVAGMVPQPLSQPAAAFAKPSCHVIQSVHREGHSGSLNAAVLEIELLMPAPVREALTSHCDLGRALRAAGHWKSPWSSSGLDEMVGNPMRGWVRRARQIIALPPAAIPSPQAQQALDRGLRRRM
jgi:hypothetical protein